MHPNVHGGSGQEEEPQIQPTVRIVFCARPHCKSVLWAEAATPFCQQCWDTYFDDCVKLVSLRDAVRDGAVTDWFGGVNHIAALDISGVFEVYRKITAGPTPWRTVFNMTIRRRCDELIWHPWERRGRDAA